MTSSITRHHDVRMRGFAARSTVEEAIHWVDAHVSRLASVKEPLESAHGRVLAEDVIAALNVPAFDRSAMDGYAVHAEETSGAGMYNPLSFKLIGQSLPGRACDVTVEPGTVVRIMTGAPMPAGANGVVPVELTRESNGQVEVTEPVAVGKHVGRVGEDIGSGTTVLSAGRRLRPQDVAVLASIGATEVPVVSQPRVRIIVTGNELVRPGEARAEHQIYEANSYLLSGLVTRDGGHLTSIEHVPDQRDAILRALTAPGADVMLVSGGSSVGAEDHAPSLVAEAGELVIHGIAMRPSSPTGIGRIGESTVFLLPGNPVSCLCAYDFFAGRAIRQLGGRSSDWPYRRSVERVARKLISVVGRTDYCRVRRTEKGMIPLAVSGASILSSTTRADGFVILPPESEGIAPGQSVDVYWYDQL
ncbi:MAG: molybdopterin molybdotransferase MoeA [Planctomycetaceae bacterium]|nr:molybdopterin molybdotransferase MoeA [Planctomycetaceae bacterium]